MKLYTLLHVVSADPDGELLAVRFEGAVGDLGVRHPGRLTQLLSYRHRYLLVSDVRLLHLQHQPTGSNN